MYKSLIFFYFLALPVLAQERPQPYPSGVNIYDSLRIVLETMHDTDQGIRKELVDAMQSASAEVGNIIERMNHTDSLNQIEIKKNTAPPRLVGEEPSG